MTSSYHMKDNGLAECKNRAAEDHIMKYTDECEIGWNY